MAGPEADNLNIWRRRASSLWGGVKSFVPRAVGSATAVVSATVERHRGRERATAVMRVSTARIAQASQDVMRASTALLTQASQDVMRASTARIALASREAAQRATSLMSTAKTLPSRVVPDVRARWIRLRNRTVAGALIFVFVYAAGTATPQAIAYYQLESQKRRGSAHSPDRSL